MLCEICGENIANTHIKTNTNGKLEEYHLCSQCAKTKGYSNMFEDFGNFFTGFSAHDKLAERKQLCKKCGISLEEIFSTGKVGCASCYDEFKEKLLPAIERMHGTTKHRGSAPKSSALKVVDSKNKLVVRKVSLIDKKNRELKEAIEKQEFERAAVLRDEIKELNKVDE